MERLTLTWTRPDGEEAVNVVFTYATPEEVSDLLTDLIDVLGDVLGGKQPGAQTHPPAIKDTVRWLEGGGRP